MKHHHNFSNWINCFIFLAIFFCLSTDSNSQSIDFCGELSPNEAYSTNPDSIVYDRFGNSYDRYITEEIYGSELTTSTMAGYFDLRFDIGNISPDLTEVIIDVFEDLSSLIEQRVNTTGCSQEIEP